MIGKPIFVHPLCTCVSVMLCVKFAELFNQQKLLYKWFIQSYHGYYPQRQSQRNPSGLCSSVPAVLGMW